MHTGWNDRRLSIEEVVSRAGHCGDVDVILYESQTSLQVCVGDPLHPHRQRLKRFALDRKADAGAWLHRTILLVYPRSRYAGNR